NAGLTKTLNYYAVAENNNVVFVGNDYGVLMSTDNGATWTNTQSMGFPSVQVMSLHARGHYIIATTYGRGMYQLDVSGITGAVANNAASNGTTEIGSVYPNPVASGSPQTNIRYSLTEDTHATIS